MTGAIKGTTVPCLSAEQQVYFHHGYKPTTAIGMTWLSSAESSGSPPTSEEQGQAAALLRRAGGCGLGRVRQRPRTPASPVRATSVCRLCCPCRASR
ncbi:nucleotidyltransferase domain-containing protein [Streptomyces xiamenensis]